MNDTIASVLTYTADISICSQICRLAVQEHGLHDAKDVPIDIEHLMDNYEPWFIRIQPTMTVPVLKYNGEYIGDSKDILYFLAEKHPEADSYPEMARSEIDQFIDRFYESFNAIAIFTFGHLQARSNLMRRFIMVGKSDVTLRKLRALVGDPELGAAVASKLQEIEGFDFSKLSDPELLEPADRQIQALLTELDKELSDGRTYVTGSSYTIADIVATALLARVHFIKGEDLLSATLREYWRNVQSRPSFSAANVCATWESTVMSRQYADFAASHEASS